MLLRDPSATSPVLVRETHRRLCHLSATNASSQCARCWASAAVRHCAARQQVTQARGYRQWSPREGSTAPAAGRLIPDGGGIRLLNQELGPGLLNPGLRRASVVSRYTDRHLVLFARGAERLAVRTLRRAMGLRLMLSGELDGAGARAELAAGEGMLLEQPSVALVRSDPEQMRWLERWRNCSSRLILPERTVRASGILRERGLHAGQASTGRTHPQLNAAGSFRGLLARHWGLQASGAGTSRYSGRGVRVAIL